MMEEEIGIAIEDDGLMTGLVLTVAIHGLLLAGLSLVLSSVVPTFVDMFEGLGGKLPMPTQVVAQFSSFSRNHTGIFICFSLAFLIVDGAVYFLARLCFGPSMSRSWVWFVGLLLASAAVVAVVAMYLPIFRITTIVSS